MSLPSHKDYRRSTASPFLSVIPEHWSEAPLKHAAEVLPSNVDKKSVDGEVTVRLCNYTDVYYNDRIVADMPLMTASASDAQIARLSLRGGDVIITKDSETADDIGRSSLVPASLPGVVCGYHLAIVRPRASSYGPFLKYFFDSVVTRAELETRANGLTRVALGQPEIGTLPLPAPPLHEQRAVADFLDREAFKIDALIAEQERLIALLQEKRQAVISNAVTKGLDPNVPMKDSGLSWLGNVPAHWQPQRLSWLFRQTKRQGHAEKTVLSVYRDYGVIRKDSRDDNLNRTPEDVSVYQLVNPGDLVINKMKAWQGSLGISDFEGITSPDYAVFSPTHGQNHAFLHLLLRCESLVGAYMGISNGIRLSQWRIEPERFLALRVHLPPIEEQTAIASFISEHTSRCDSTAAEAEAQVLLLKERRSALITAAVTGQIDVRGLVESAA